MVVGIHHRIILDSQSGGKTLAKRISVLNENTGYFLLQVSNASTSSR